MVSASVPGMHGWGNCIAYRLLSGALGPSLHCGEGLRAPFLLGLRRGEIRVLSLVRRGCV